MNSQKFVDIIKDVVIDDSIKSVQDVLIKPPGKAPLERNVELSKWYNNLADGEKAKVLAIIREAVESSVFGFFCVLDGVRAIESGENKGILKLYFENNLGQVLINNPNDDYLHNML